jgi:hypothetical protein
MITVIKMITILRVIILGRLTVLMITLRRGPPSARHGKGRGGPVPTAGLA